jgi:hypothetical protein
MRLLPGYEMASNAQPYIVKTAPFYTARTGRGLQKICADLKHWFLFFLSMRKEKRRPPPRLAVARQQRDLCWPRANWRRGDSKPKSPFTEDTQQPYRNDTESSQVQTEADLTNRATEQILTDSIQNHNTSLHKKYAICMHQNNFTPESLPAELAEIIRTWPTLPEHIKAAIMALIKVR